MRVNPGATDVGPMKKSTSGACKTPPAPIRRQARSGKTGRNAAIRVSPAGPELTKRSQKPFSHALLRAHTRARCGALATLGS